MASDPQSTFRERVREHLATLEQQFLPVLASLVSHKYPKDVAVLDFEVFSDSFTSGFPARAFFMDNSNSEFFLYVNGEAQYPCPVDPELLNVDQIYPESLESDLTTESPESDPWGLATAEFIAWFHSCWSKSGGKAFSLAATIAPHDSSEEFNLKTGQWQPRGSSFGA